MKHFLALCCMLIAGPLAAHEFLPLWNNTPPNNFNEPVAITSDGSLIAGQTECMMAGGWCDGPDGPLRYFWTQADGLQPIDLSYDGVVTLEANQSVGNVDILGMSADGTYLTGDFGIITSFGSGGSSYDYGHAFRWSESGGFEELGRQPGYSTTQPRAISADGQTIVGYIGVTTLGWKVGQTILDIGGIAMRWTPDGGLEDLNPPGFFLASTATLVSDNGDVIVGEVELLNDIVQAFRWTEEGGFTGLGSLPGGTGDSTAYAMTPDGGVIVGTSRSAQGGEAFRWTPEGGMQGLGSLPGANYPAAFATDISDDGNVVVGFSTYIGNYASQYQAFRWTAETGMQALGFLPYDSPTVPKESMARFVSSDGSVIIGTASNETRSTCSFFCFSEDVFIWTESTGMLGLRDLLTQHGIDTAEWEFGTGSIADRLLVSEDGSTIVVVSPTVDPSSPYASAYSDYRRGFVIKLNQLAAEIDVLPFSATNELDPEQAGLTDVAILGLDSATGDDSNFAALDVVPESVSFGPSAAASSVGAVTGDIDSDGNTDMWLSFPTLDTGITCGDTEVELTGMTTGGDSFRAADSIVTDCDTGTCH